MRTAPSTDRGRASVARVLDAARALFAEHGVRPTTLDQIGQAAGVGRGQLYHFFTGKPDLVTEVVAQQVERVLGAQQPLLGELATAADVRAWCRIAVEQYAHDDDPVRCPIGALVHELGETDAAARAALAAGLTRWQAALASGLRRVRERGELAPGAEPDAVAAALLAAYQGGVLIAAATGDLTTLRHALAAVAASTLAGAA